MLTPHSRTCPALVALLAVVLLVSPAVAIITFDWSFTDTDGNTDSGSPTNLLVSGSVTFGNDYLPTVSGIAATGFTVNGPPPLGSPTFSFHDTFSFDANLLSLPSPPLDVFSNTWTFSLGVPTQYTFDLRSGGIVSGNPLDRATFDTILAGGIVSIVSVDAVGNPSRSLVSRIDTNGSSPVFVESTSAVPEPSAFLCVGLVGLGLVGWKKIKSKRKTK